MHGKIVTLEISQEMLEMHLPSATDVLTMKSPGRLMDPAAAIREAMIHPIGCPGLESIVRAKLAQRPDATATVVISDNTRPVPYRGEEGILWPVIETLLACGLPTERILIIVACGTHRALNEEELRRMLDPRIFAAGIRIMNHDSRNHAGLAYLGKTSRGTRVFLNRAYLEAGIKILTGLVESHFMAGASGGCKSVCPGLVGIETTYIFHGAPMLASAQVGDLILEGNPCHEESLEVAKMAGVDFIINVTIDDRFNVTGVFAGDLERAHAKAVEKLKEYAIIPIEKEYDVVISHAGFVGVNHYQAAKAGVAAVPALKPGGRLIMVANNTDPDPVGSPMYRTCLGLLKLIGPECFLNLINSPDWVFLPDQWQVQMWTKLFTKIPMGHLVYFSPQMSVADYAILPGRDGNEFLPVEKRYRTELADTVTVVENAVQEAVRVIRMTEGREAFVAYLADGPYGIPIPAQGFVSTK